MPKASKATTSQKVSPPVNSRSKNIAKAAPAAAAPAAKADANKPKKAVSSYMIFNSQMQSQMKSMKKFSNLSFAEKNKVVSESWSKLSAQQKEQYVDLAEEDKKRFKNEMTQFEKKGWFRDKDGNDSRKMAKPSRKKANSENEEMEDESPKGKKGKAASQPVPAAPENKPTKPKAVKSAFMFWMGEQYHITAKANPTLKMTEIGKMNAEKWKDMDEKKRAPYQKQSDADRTRHEKETKQFNELGYFFNSDGVKSTLIAKKGRILEFEPDTVTPKRALSPYIFWGKEWHLKNKDSKLSSTEKIRKIAEEWNALGQKEKAKFEALTAKDGKRYDKQVAELKKNGFFLMEDGTKSSDHVKKAPKVKRVKN